ncbi:MULTISPECIES: TIGR04283 family arsenosugar biosynthesis glycosyltransferase [Spirosoma]|uniref:Glycosyltransferase n=1 Tax=Spirosoma sordidisoli TaxID=2502893 RepID=A0A4Q2UQH6_9BACT|nr:MULTISPECIES: TIGR04283 family arsenosugar biosynthesis glycosyltransferase [Spirosoma]RYC72013.1 glycosyltransferase [Spirosoma sordidisoli]
MTLSIIIPTLNEAANIGRLVRDLKKYGNDQLADLIVVDGGSTDATVDEARQAGARVVNSPLPGRANQMNAGASLTSGEVLYFVHADVTINPDFVQDIGAAIASGNEAGCYRFRFASSHPLLRLNSYGTRFSGLMSRGGDQTLFITRSLFDRLGGFRERYVIMEDFDMIARIRQVAPFCIIPKDVIVSARKYESNSWLRVQVANLTAFSMFFMKVSPVRIAQTYRRMLH